MKKFTDNVVVLKRYFFVIVICTLLAIPFNSYRPVYGAVPTVPIKHIVVDPNFNGDNKAVADFTGDGLPDIIVASDQMNLYTAPTWTKTLLATAQTEFTTDMQSVDVDKDGDIDIVTPDYTWGLYWYANPLVGGGAWTRHTVGNGGTYHDVEVGDVEGDGDVDVVTRGHGGPTTVWLQTNPDSWSKTQLTTATNGEGLHLGDIDRDGDLDIAENGWWLEAPAVKTDANWLRHDFAGGWSDTVTTNVSDFNGDGRLDIGIAASEATGKLAWYEAPATPTSPNWPEHVVDASIDFVHRFEVADFNKDGLPDIAFAEMAQSARKRVGFYLNNGGATTWTQQVFSTNGSHNIKLGDIGNDGDIDVVGANWQVSGVDLWENGLNPKLSLDQWTYKQVSSAADQTFGLTFGDVNHDGPSDIIEGPRWYSNPGGDMTGSWTQSAPFPNAVEGILTTDVNGNGLTDIITQKNGSQENEIGWLEATDAAATSWTYTLIGLIPPASDGGGAQGARLAQLVAGGKPEIVISSATGIYYFAIPANPAGGNWPKTLVNTNAVDEGFGTGDIDGDGDIDVAAGTGSSKNVQWYANPGNGASSWPAVTIANVPEFGFPDRFAVADLNGDAKPDVIATEENGGSIADAETYWFQNPTNPTTDVWTKHLVATQYTTNSMDTADMDGDGDTDIITGEHRGTLKVTIWENNGSGAFTGHLVDQGKESHLGARVFDLDGDGDQDIVSNAYDAYQFLHLWRNNAKAGGTPTPPPQCSNNIDDDGDGFIDYPADTGCVSATDTTESPNPQMTDTTRPTATITNPANNATVANTVTASVNATDNVGVTQVELYLDGTTLIGTDTATPFNIDWNTTATTNGAHSLTAKAFDAANNTATSAPVSVTVSNSTTPPASAGDEFNTTTLDSAWTFNDVKGGDSYSLTANPGHLQIKAAAGTYHDCWGTDLSCVRMQRPWAGDGVYEVKIDGAPLSNSAWQEYGIFLYMNPTNHMRIAFWNNGQTFATVWATLNGNGTNPVGSNAITLGSSNYIRFTKTGTTFKMEYSTNGTTWNNVGSFTNSSFVPTQIGMEVDNDGSNLLTTGNFDYFHMPGSVTPPPPDTQAPTAPANLNATASSSTQVNLSWTAASDNVGVTSYNIYRNGVKVNSATGTSFSDTGLTPTTDYSYQVTAKDAAGNEGPLSNIATATTPATPQRVTTGLQTLYTFKQGSGTTVNDVSGVGTPLNLSIQDPSKIQWLPGGGLNFAAAGSVVKSPAAATKVINALRTTGKASMEAWVKPANVSQTGPARIVALSNGTNNNQLDMQLGQAAKAGSFRLRTSANSFNSLQPANVFTSTQQPVHVVSTFDGTTMRLYLNGVQVGSQAAGGNFSTWTTTYPLLLGNESSLTRSWLGSMYLTAVYDRALSQAEIQQNYQARY